MPNLQESPYSCAVDALDHFDTKIRNDGVGFIYMKKDAEWIKEMVYKAHGGETPNDYTYQFIVDSLDAIRLHEEQEESSEAIQADIFTSYLTRWLDSANSRVGYVTQALEEFTYKDGFELLSNAQLIERLEVFDIVWDACEERAALLNTQ